MLTVSRGFPALQGGAQPAPQVCQRPGLCLFCFPVLSFWRVPTRKSPCEVRNLFSTLNTSYNINRAIYMFTEIDVSFLNK